MLLFLCAGDMPKALFSCKLLNKFVTLRSSHQVVPAKRLGGLVIYPLGTLGLSVDNQIGLLFLWGKLAL
jgi:hypothetical protein